MDFFTIEDLKLIGNYARLEFDSDKHNELRVIYDKLGHLCNLIQMKGYGIEIRKDPRKQGGPGKFVFQDYQWAKIYPKEYVDECTGKFAYIIGLNGESLHFHMMGIKGYYELDDSIKASQKCWKEIDFEGEDYDYIVNQFIEFDEANRLLFIETGAALGIQKFQTLINEMNFDKIINLLKYKKQIILQGPPGTGKTKFAKELAKSLCAPSYITESDIKSVLSVGLKIKSSTDYTSYEIKSISDTNISLSIKNSSNEYKPTINEVIDAYKSRLWEGGQKNGNDPYAAAIAKYIYKNIAAEQSEIIQFHPSYSYEDFVRGIVSMPNDDGDGIIYEAENKTLAKFANKALLNFNKAKVEHDENVEVKSNLDRFISYVIEKIDADGKFDLTENVYLFYVDNKRFKYKGNNWTAHANGLNMNFSEMEKIIQSNQFSRPEINKNTSLNELTRQHATYFTKLLEKYQQFVIDTPIEVKDKPAIKNYVLIIDEINRANLSSVLGELIYALEYRGKAIESMYAIDGKNELILPTNLYIIGTMNTADRSVGNIDYAIRRRFAFVDVQPKDLSSELGDNFHKILFEKIASLFNHDTYLSEEFEAKDVQLGHSYFIDKSEEGGTMAIRLQYEIKPILREYVKDGILIGDKIIEIIEMLTA